jgi:hypothetical protein
MGPGTRSGLSDPHQNASRCTVDWGSRNAVGPGKSHKSGLSIPPMERDVSESEKSGFSEALTVGQQLDLNLPDSRAVRDAYEQAHRDLRNVGANYPFESRTDLRESSRILATETIRV